MKETLPSLNDEAVSATKMTTTGDKKILIVDDHPVFREGLAQLIAQESGLNVVGKAATAASAMEMAQNLNPDLAIIDISLQGKNGIELLKSLKATNPDLPVVIFSMHDEGLYAERALRAGASGYLMKGAPVEDLLDAIRKVLAGELYLSQSMNNSLIKTSLGNRSGKVSPLDALSDRQLEVLELYGRGNNSRAIAEKLRLSVKTVEVHRENIKQKLGLSSSLELIRYATRWVDQQN